MEIYKFGAIFPSNISTLLEKGNKILSKVTVENNNLLEWNGFFEFPPNNFIFINKNIKFYFYENFKEIKEEKIDRAIIHPYKLETNVEKDRLYVSDRNNYEILVLNENFEILISWNDEKFRKSSLVDGLCFNNNRLYLTDSHNNQIIFFVFILEFMTILR